MHSEKVPYYILDLLQQVPVVYVPGLGKFEAIFHPAVIDVPQAVIRPPHVEAAFGAEDGVSNILPVYIHFVTGISKDDAAAFVDEFVNTVHDKLAGGENFTVEHFGTFSKSSLGILHFTPDWDAFNLSFRGLEAIDISSPVVTTTTPVYNPPVFDDSYLTEPVKETYVDPRKESSDWVSDQQEVAERAAAETKPVVPAPVISEKTSRMWWTILATALILITALCAYLAWDILSNRQKINTTATTNEIEVDPGTMDEVATIPDTTIENQEIPYTDSIPAETNDVQTTPETPTTPEIVGTPCRIVVGAFGNPENVSRMKEKIASMGYASEEIKGGALTKVAILTSCDKTTLQQTLDAARSSINPDAWVY